MKHMTGFGRMLDFLSSLKENNNRDWFTEHKAEYESVRSECFNEIDILIDKIACFDSQLAGLSAKDSVFRIYRDIRFSADKTPYKTHFGIVLGRGGRKCKEAAAYLHIEPDDCALYGGIWFPEPQTLACLRRDIYENIDEFLEILENTSFKKRFPVLTGDSLKRVPRGYPTNDPHADILRLKEYLVVEHLADGLFRKKGWQDRIAEDIEVMKPLNDFLNFTLGEMQSV